MAHRLVELVIVKRRSEPARDRDAVDLERVCLSRVRVHVEHRRLVVMTMCHVTTLRLS
jgi:hypothetical protein